MYIPKAVQEKMDIEQAEYIRSVTGYSKCLINCSPPLISRSPPPDPPPGTLKLAREAPRPLPAPLLGGAQRPPPRRGAWTGGLVAFPSEF